MTNLEIITTQNEQGMHLRCSGRLDANHTAYLNDVIDQLVREGHYHLLLDFSALEYLSSAGIRLLVSQYKSLQSVNGSFCLCAVSEPVEQILQMVGMSDMLRSKVGPTGPKKTKELETRNISLHNYRFSLHPLEAGEDMKAVFFGTPERVLDAAFNAGDARELRAKEKQYALGLGAIGESYASCKNRFGEFLMLNGNVAYLPADGSKKPDYMINSGQLIASLTALYGLRFDGDFSAFVRFESPNKEESLGLSQLLEGISQLLESKEYLVVFIAEINGLVGVSLNQSPVDNKNIFGFPEVKNTLNFTTEPEHSRMLALSLGFCSLDPGEELKRFTRALCPDSACYAHFHTAVFPYMPLKKTGIDLNETIDSLFDSGTLTTILHLACDSREIAGLGESQFIQGYCWIAPVSSIQFNTNK